MRKPTNFDRGEAGVGWRVIYLLFVAALGLLYLERRTTMTPFEHTEALVAIVMMFFLLIWMWLDAEDRR